MWEAMLPGIQRISWGEEDREVRVFRVAKRNAKLSISRTLASLKEGGELGLKSKLLCIVWRAYSLDCQG